MGNKINQSFSPILFSGLVAKNLPKAPINYLIDRFTKQMVKNHPSIVERLQHIEGTHFLICPTDLPHGVSLTVGNLNLDAKLADDRNSDAPDVTIMGPFMLLLSMLDGTQDGDALFFSRNITVEGNTEALLTLRNAIDSDDVDLKEEILSSFGFMRKVAEATLSTGTKLYQSASDDLDKINVALIQSLANRLSAVENENQQLKLKLRDVEKTTHKLTAKVTSLDKKVRSS